MKRANGPSSGVHKPTGRRPGETSKCRDTQIAARQFLPLSPDPPILFSIFIFKQGAPEQKKERKKKKKKKKNKDSLSGEPLKSVEESWGFPKGGFCEGGEISIIGVGARTGCNNYNFASNPCENLRVYIGFNKELPHKKREINYCNRCAHPPQLLRFPPLRRLFQGEYT